MMTAQTGKVIYTLAVSSTSRPSASILAAAIVSFFISGVSLLTAIFFAVGMALVSARGHGTPNQALGQMMLVFLVVIWVGTAAFGIIIGAGLIRLRNWARISAMLWAVVMLFCAIFALAVAAAVSISKLPGTPVASPVCASVFFSTVGVSSI